MRALKFICAGIGFNVFGIACWEVIRISNWYGLGIPGLICPAIGIIMILYGLFTDEEDLKRT